MANIVLAVRIASSKWPRAISARKRTARALRQPADLLDFGEQQVDPFTLQLQQDLPIRVVEPGRPVRLSQRESAVFLQLLTGQLLEGHGQQLLAVLECLLVEEEPLLLQHALHVVEDRIAGIHLLELRQEPVS